MAAKKLRISIPQALAAKILFASDRTCCVCRESGKAVQIHHIDDNPANNSQDNLAVLCLDHHTDTQLSGGFGRHLDAEQVRLYRTNWLGIVSRRRELNINGPAGLTPSTDEIAESEVKVVAAKIALYQEHRDHFSLALLYSRIGNNDLRDRHIELALQDTPSASLEIMLRNLQDRISEVPLMRQQQAIREANQDWTNKAYILETLGKPVEATKTSLNGISKSIKEGNLFTAAYYIKHQLRKLSDTLFEIELQKNIELGSLWWHIRCLQELGWDDELRALMKAKRKEIEEGDDILIKREMAEILDLPDDLIRYEKQLVDGPETARKD